MEAAILALVVGLLVALGIAGGRLVTAESAADQAAGAAARIASINRDPTTAHDQAVRTARDVIDATALHCVALDVRVDVSGFARPLGVPASVRADVRCSVRWSDLGLPGAPGTHEVTASFTSPIDQLRERP